jgi:succinoglycan biosynthesis transport protein ExoP
VPLDLRNLLQAARAGWWLLVVGLLAGLSAGGLLTWAATPLYSSSTRLFVSATNNTDTSAAYQGDLFSQQRVTSYAELLRGEQLASQVVDDLDLTLSPHQVASEVTAAPIPNTVILQVTVTDKSPLQAQHIATSLAQHFTTLVTQLETPAGAQVSTVKVTTVQAPEVNGNAVSPDFVRNLLLGGVLGLLVGSAAALIRARLDNTVKTNDDVQDITGAGVIGKVIEDARLSERHVVTSLDEHSAVAEGFRAIRTNLQFINVDHPPRVIVVASSVPGEGKSTLAVNLSTALSQSGSRVILVEADLRRPRVTGYMGLVGGAGLTNVLAGTADLEEVVQQWADSKLMVLAAGPMPPNPSEMLGSAQMRTLVGALRESYDYVLIDTPPLLPVTDATVLSVVADGTLLTTRYGRTRRDQLAEAVATLARVESKLLGVVLNRVPVGTASIGRYGYEYSYLADSGRLGKEGSSRRSRGRRRSGASRAKSDHSW